MKTVIILLSLFIAQVALPQLTAEIDRLDTSSYFPQKSTLSDLVFTVEVEGLRDRINEKKSFGVIKELYFKVYWEQSSGFAADVYGLPNGFKEVKASLSSLVLSRMDYVIPTNIKDQLKNLSLKKIDNFIVATDPTGKSFFSEMKLEISKDGQLKQLVLMSPNGMRTTQFESSPKSWSKNKFVFDKVIMTINEGGQITKVTNTIEYHAVDGIGFPKEIFVETESKLAVNTQEQKDVIQKDSVRYYLKNFQINTGAAKARFRQGN